MTAFHLQGHPRNARKYTLAALSFMLDLNNYEVYVSMEIMASNKASKTHHFFLRCWYLAESRLGFCEVGEIASTGVVPCMWFSVYQEHLIKSGASIYGSLFPDPSKDHYHLAFVHTHTDTAKSSLLFGPNRVLVTSMCRVTLIPL